MFKKLPRSLEILLATSVAAAVVVGTTTTSTPLDSITSSAYASQRKSDSVIGPFAVVAYKGESLRTLVEESQAGKYTPGFLEATLEVNKEKQYLPENYTPDTMLKTRTIVILYLETDQAMAYFKLKPDRRMFKQRTITSRSPIYLEA